MAVQRPPATWAELVIAWLAIPLAIVAVIQLGLLIHSNTLQREQNEIAVDTARTQLRAYVLAVQAELVGLNDRAGPFDIRVSVRNSGQTPAREVTISLAVQWVSNEEKGKAGAGPVKENTPTSLGPDDEVQLGRRIDEVRRREIKNRRGTLHAVGEIHYKDSFGESHTSTFHFIQGGEYNPESKLMGPAATGNDWD